MELNIIMMLKQAYNTENHPEYKNVAVNSEFPGWRQANGLPPRKPTFSPTAFISRLPIHSFPGAGIIRTPFTQL
jgi:hypothetical protein